MKRVKFKGWFACEDWNFIGGERIVYFQMDVIDNKGNFEGTATDDESREAFKDDAITVKGFFDDGVISFLKMYPYNYYGTNHYGVEVDYSKKNHVVEYFGVWDDVEHKFVGTYTVVNNKHRIDDVTGLYLYNELVYEYQWEMIPEEVVPIKIERLT